MARDIKQRKIIFDEKVLQKQLPHARESEAAVLSAILLDNNRFDDVIDILQPHHFYDQKYRLLYEVMLSLRVRGLGIDIITMRDALPLENYANVEYMDIINLVEGVFDVRMIESHAKLILEKSALRSLVDVSINTIQSVYNYRGDNLNELIDRAEKSVFEAVEFSSEKPLLNITQLIAPAIQAWGRNSNNLGITSFKGLDRLTMGFQNKELIILAARPSMGKTAIAACMAHLAAVEGKTVLVFSLEMSDIAITQRLVSIESAIPFHHLRAGKCNSDEWVHVLDAAARIQNWKLFIDDTSSYYLHDIKQRARRAHKMHKLDIIIIDYLQCVNTPNQFDRHLEIGDITKGLKSLAKELNIPVIALSQLSRKLESRDNKRPILSDLRDSGAIEQDADLVLFLYRDHVYYPDSDPFDAEIIVAKQRNGPCETVKLRFDPELMKFSD